jgi:hypothetical protein
VAAAGLAAVLGLRWGQPAFGIDAAEQSGAPPGNTQIPIVIQVPYGATVSNGLVMNAAEVQSTVIAPGKKSQCPFGCLLISNDNEKSPGKIIKLALNQLGGTPAVADLEPLEGTDRMIKSNDHDLITLTNGDVLYIRMGRTKAVLPPEAVWFDHAWKLPYGEEPDGEPNGFGPGARSEIFVWRSVDGGGSFQFLSGIDMALVDDDFGTATDYSGGLPQAPASFTTPGTEEQPVWQMGGTDGPLARVDPLTGRVFLVAGVVGCPPDPAQSYFAVMCPRMRRSVVMMSEDNGETWERLGTLGHGGWRTDVVARANNQLAFAAFAWHARIGEGHSFVSTATIGQFPVPDLDPPMDSVKAPEKQGQWGWSTKPKNHPLIGNVAAEGDTMGIALTDQTILTRSPSSGKMVLAFMDTLEGDKGDGHRVYLFDGNDTWTALPPIAPLSPNKNNFTLHLTPVDLGHGPILLYWYDVDTVAKKASIRGRLIITDTSYTSDFTIAPAFSVSSYRSYGDYHTAGGYAASRTGPYNFYPIWVQPDGKVHFTHVQYAHNRTLEVSNPAPPPPGPVQFILGLFVQPADITRQRELVDVRELTTVDTEEEWDREETRVPPQ